MTSGSGMEQGPGALSGGVPLSATGPEVIEAALAAGLRLAVAESCTGGMVAAALTDRAGSSGAFLAGFVTYSNAAKTALLEVPEALIARLGAVSEEVAGAMALGARSRGGADVAVSTTGIAGPGGSEFKPEGRVCFGLATAAGVHTQTIDFGPLGRDRVREAAMRHALGLLRAAVTA